MATKNTHLSTIADLNLAGKRVFLRADLNVPLKNGMVTEDFRLLSALPTINYLLKNNCKITLATHLGQPEPHPMTNYIDPKFSTKIIAQWLKNNHYAIDYEPDLLKAQEKSHHKTSHIILLENLRFFSGEKENNVAFSDLLAACADIYINDAFGLIHRNDNSVTLLPQQFTKENRAIGLLMTNEISQLNKLKQEAKQPFVLVLGGSKVIEKLTFLEDLLINSTIPITTILIGGALIYPFQRATENDEKWQNDFTTKELVTHARRCIAQAASRTIKLIVPHDYKTSNDTIIDLGPETIKLYTEEIMQARTIFSVGTMGMYEDEDAREGTKVILQAIANSPAYTVIGGGDGVAAAYFFGIEHHVDFLSTGGSATLAFLGSKNPENDFLTLQVLTKK